MDRNQNDNVAISTSTSSKANYFVKNEYDHDQEREIDTVKRGRAINFAEKIHLVLSHKHCKGRLITLIIYCGRFPQPAICVQIFTPPVSSQTHIPWSNPDAISWLPSGKSFCITNKQKFVQTILPKYFKSRANFNSFERRLRTWGFEKIDTTNNLYIFSHESFNQKSSTEHDSIREPSCDFMKHLRVVLSNAECQPFISWLPSGNSFCINHKDQFVKNVLHEYFGVPHFRAFVLTLKSKGFKRLQTSDYVGDAVYSHPLFQVGRPELCGLMRRVLDSHREPEADIRLSASGIVIRSRAPSTFAAPNPVSILQGTTNSPAFSPQMTVAYPIPARGGFVSNMPVREMIRVMNPTNPLPQTNIVTYPYIGRFPELNFHQPQVPPSNPNIALLSDQDTCFLSPTDCPSLLRHPRSEGIPQQTNVPIVACNQKNPVLQIPHKFEYDRITKTTNYDSFVRYVQTQGSQGQPAALTARCFQGDSIIRADPKDCHYMNSTSDHNMSLCHVHPVGSPEQINIAKATFQSDSNGKTFDYNRNKAKNDMELTMLEIDSELLKVKELKLLTIQRKLKVRMAMEDIKK